MCRRKRQQPVPPPKTAYPREGGPEYLSVAQGRLDHQMDALGALETKAQAVIGGVLAIAAVLGSVAALRSTQHPLTCLSWSMLTAAGLAGGFALTFAVLAVRVQTWISYPSPYDTWSVAQEPDFAFRIARTLDAASDENDKALGKKSGHVAMALWGVVVCAAAVFATTVALLLG